MIANCAIVYVDRVPHAPNKATITIDSSKCEPLQPAGHYDYGKGLLIVYGSQGEKVVIDRSNETVSVTVVPLRGKLLRKVELYNLGPVETDVAERVSYGGEAK